MAAIQCKGLAARVAQSPLEPFSFERRAVGPNDVLIDIKFCGICHSDIHKVTDAWNRNIFPMVPGHEIAGIVNRTGEKVTKFKVGDPVGVGCFVDSCRSCRSCKAKDEQYCDNGLLMTYNSRQGDGSPTFGGYSKCIVVNENYVLRMPKSIPLEQAAPLLCAGITTYSALHHWKAGPGKIVAILGLGGLGHIGIRIAKAMGCEVHVFSQSEKKREDARRLGADFYHIGSDPESMKLLGNTFDLILNTVSAPIDWPAYLNTLRVDGTMVALGIPDNNDILIKVPQLIYKRRSIAGAIIGGISETQEMLDFCDQHNIGCDVEIVCANNVNEAYDRVNRSDVKFRFVIDLETLQ